MGFESTATRIWKRLTPAERLSAATEFWREPPAELLGGALSAIIKARRLRPQVARSLSGEEKARALAGVLEPGETVAGSLLVALHLGQRRSLLRTFLDAVGLAHEDGILKDEPPEVPVTVAEPAARAGVEALARAFPRHEVETYLNTLWHQDPERWAVLEKSTDWL